MYIFLEDHLIISLESTARDGLLLSQSRVWLFATP